MDPKIELQLEAIKMVQDFCKWMMLVQGGLFAAYGGWVASSDISPTNTIKTITFIGFGGALVLASLRFGFLSDMIQRLDGVTNISDLGISRFGLLQHVKMSWLGVPQHLFFFVGLIGFALSAWGLR